MTIKELTDKMNDIFGDMVQEVEMTIWDDENQCYRRVEWPDGHALRLKRIKGEG